MSAPTMAAFERKRSSITPIIGTGRPTPLRKSHCHAMHPAGGDVAWTERVTVLSQTGPLSDPARAAGGGGRPVESALANLR